MNAIKNNLKYLQWTQQCFRPHAIMTKQLILKKYQVANSVVFKQVILFLTLFTIIKQG